MIAISQKWLLIAVLAGWSNLACAALPSTAPAVLNKPAAGPVSPSNIISDLSAINRTRPFPSNEKTAYFVNIKSGDKVHSPFRVGFVVSGMGVAPVKAGKLDNTGHHHILIDVKETFDASTPIPFDKPGEYQKQHYKHFEKGETETVLDLPAGRHTLKLLFADFNNMPITNVVSREIYIDVVER